MKHWTVDSLVAHIRTACLSLPEVVESVAWDDPVFLVAGRAFAGCMQVIPWGPSLRLRVGLTRQRVLLSNSLFFPTPRLFHRGWVSLKLADMADWQIVDELVRVAYKNVAPARLLRKQRHAVPDAAEDGRA